MNRSFAYTAIAALAIGLLAGHASAALVTGINFQPADADVPVDYFVDSGLTYGDRGNGLTYGWSADLTDETRDRDVLADQRYDTLIHMQGETWELALAPGEYYVFVAAGDADYTDQVNSLIIEGLLFNDPDGGDNFDEYEINSLMVTDGRLTITAAPGADNPKLAFVEVVPIPEPASLALGLAGSVLLVARPRRRLQ